MDLVDAIRAVRHWLRTRRALSAQYQHHVSQSDAGGTPSGPTDAQIQALNAGPFSPTRLLVGSAIAVVFGILAQVAVLVGYRGGGLDLPTAAMIFAVGVGLTVAGLWHLYSVFVVERTRQTRQAATAQQHPDAPWLLNDEWAQRKVVDRSGLSSTIFLWIFAIGWWIFCAFLWGFDPAAMRAAAQGSWLQAALMLFLAGVGVLGIVAAVAKTIKWLRYGASTLHIDTLPGYLGNRFRGNVVARIPEATPLEAEIACEHVSVIWTVTPKGGRKKELIYKPLWTHRWRIERDRMARTKENSVSIPIDAPLPDDQPPFATDAEGAGIRWVLRLGADGATMGGAEVINFSAPGLGGFSAEYLIPVYARV